MFLLSVFTPWMTFIFSWISFFGPSAVADIHAAEPPCTLPETYIIRDEIPLYDMHVYQSRRNKVMASMQGKLAIVSGEAVHDFFYLTGYKNRNALAILAPDHEHPFMLFVQPRDPTNTLWDGPRLGMDGAMTQLHADTALDIAFFADVAANLMARYPSVSILRAERNSLGISLKDIAGEYTLEVFDDLTDVVHEMRIIKDHWEQDMISRAVDVTVLAHKRVLSTVKPGLFEYDVRAEIEYVFQKNNCTTGFNSIVGSGPNAGILHYTHYDRQLRSGDLLLIDIGAEFNGYTADVTRTIPVNGAFTPEQRVLYELVLKAADAGLSKMTTDHYILDCHHAATDVMVRGLHELGLIVDTTSWWQKRFYIHYRNTHYMGLYVHDVGSYGDFNPARRDAYLLNPEIRGRKLEPGMVLTIEPGIYLLADRLEHLETLFGHLADIEELNAFAEAIRPLYEKYAGIGIRIEDDVLITENGHKVLSANAPRTVAEIENAMKR